MSERTNATCCICGKDYYMCLSCKDAMKLHPWKMYTDSAEHYKIHQIIHGYSTKMYTKEEAGYRLKNVDLSDLKYFKPNIRLIIEDILREEIADDAQPKEKVVVEKPVYSRKRNYKAG